MLDPLSLHLPVPIWMTHALAFAQEQINAAVFLAAQRLPDIVNRLQVHSVMDAQAYS